MNVNWVCFFFLERQLMNLWINGAEKKRTNQFARLTLLPSFPSIAEIKRAIDWEMKRRMRVEPQRRLSGRVGLSFLCGLRAGPPAIAPHKEDKHSPATLPFNKFILSFFFFLARRAWTVLVVGYGWGPALCRGRTQSNWFHQFPLSSLPSFVSLKKKERVDWLINKRKDEREWNDCLWDESWRAIQP